MRQLSIGLDYGSDSVRGVLVDTRDGQILNTAVHHYSRWAEGRYCDAARNQFRQHPADYLEGAEQVIRAIIAGIDPREVVGIGIDTTGSTPCAVNAEGTPLAMTPEFADDPAAMFWLWKDHTALQEAADINRFAAAWHGENYLKYEGGIYSSEWFWAKLLHLLRVAPRVAAAAASFVEHCDWITAELTNRTAPAQLPRSRCAAGHKAMWHTDWNGLPPEEFLAGIDPLLAGWRAKLYTETQTAERPVGTLSPRWAAKLGLPETVRVSGGAFDCHMGAVGTGIRPGQLVKTIGTSTCDIMVAPALNRCVRGICGQVDGSVVPGMIGLEAGQSAFGDIYAWFKRFLGYTGAEISLPRLEQEAAALPPGANGVLALDWQNGRRTPDANQALTGALFGLTLGTTPPAVFRALVESTAFGARAIAERLTAEGVKIDSVAAIGGIPRKSPFTMQILADVMNMELQVSASDQTCALGAAMFGATAGGAHPDIPHAMAAMAPGYTATYRPNAANVPIYHELYARYRRLGGAVEEEIATYA